jgi:HD-GYP domain-containing protein (c-di-GMP phosphodiesterase class II)
MELPQREMRVLIKGAFVHDIGNVVLPDSILLKRDRLDEVEFEAVKTHCYHGADIVGRSEWLAEAAEVVRNHHEKWDGTGYPSGLKGEDIPLTARVFAVADVFDALTSQRPYRPPLDFDKAMDILQIGRGGHFDPAVVDAFTPMARRLYDEAQSKPPAILEAEMRDAVFGHFRAGS